MRLTKGKQKIEMKKLESRAARVVTFSKRKSGIFKNLNEIVSQCQVETIFLVFSETGKPYTFAYPSLKEAFGRFEKPLTHEPFASINMGPLVGAYERRKNQDLMQRYFDFVEELEINNEMEKILKNSKQEKEERMWWRWTTFTEGVSVIKLKCMCQAFVDLHVCLSYMAFDRFGSNGYGSSSSQESYGRDGEIYA